jgi:hypothetical protein
VVYVGFGKLLVFESRFYDSLTRRLLDLYSITSRSRSGHGGLPGVRPTSPGKL